MVHHREAFQNVNIVEALDDHLPPVSGDRNQLNQLQQVLVNLSLNACEAMADGGTLMIATSVEDGRVVADDAVVELAYRLFQRTVMTAHQPVGDFIGFFAAVSSL